MSGPQSFTLALAVASVCVLLQARSAAGQTQNHSFWEQVLGKHVNTTDQHNWDAGEFPSVYHDTPPRENVLKCLRLAHTQPRASNGLVKNQQNSTSQRTVPTLNIIITVTANRMQQGGGDLPYIQKNWQEYADRHGFNFRLNVLDKGEYAEYLPFSKRWKSMMDRYWKEGDWILHVDSDSIVLKVDRDLRPFMQTTKHDFLFHVRSNAEITAAAVMFRMTPFSKCFLELWSSLGTRRGRNWDNGDLNALLMEFAHPQHAMTCVPFRIGMDYGNFMDCFKAMLPYWSHVGATTPFKFYYPLQGFWRSHEGPSWFSTKENGISPYHYKCWQRDIIGHGWKYIGEGLWGNRTEAQVQQGIANCEFMTVKEQLHWAKKCCIWHHPACLNRNGINICRTQGQCLAQIVAWGLPAGCKMFGDRHPAPKPGHLLERPTELEPPKETATEKTQKTEETETPTPKAETPKPEKSAQEPRSTGWWGFLWPSG